MKIFFLASMIVWLTGCSSAVQGPSPKEKIGEPIDSQNQSSEVQKF